MKANRVQCRQCSEFADGEVFFQQYYFKNFNITKTTMLDRKYILEHVDEVKTNCLNRGVKADIDRFVALETARKTQRLFIHRSFYVQ